MKRLWRQPWIYVLLAWLAFELFISYDSLNRYYIDEPLQSFLSTVQSYAWSINHRLSEFVYMLIKLVLVSLVIITSLEEEMTTAFMYIARRTSYEQFLRKQMIKSVTLSWFTVIIPVIFAVAIIDHSQTMALLNTILHSISLFSIAAVSLLLVPLMGRLLAAAIPAAFFLITGSIRTAEGVTAYRSFARISNYEGLKWVEFLPIAIWTILKASVLVLIVIIVAPRIIRKKANRGYS